MKSIILRYSLLVIAIVIIANINISNAERKGYPRTSPKNSMFKAVPTAIKTFYKSAKQKKNVVPAYKDMIDSLGESRGYAKDNVVVSDKKDKTKTVPLFAAKKRAFGKLGESYKKEGKGILPAYMDKVSEYMIARGYVQ